MNSWRHPFLAIQGQIDVHHSGHRRRRVSLAVALCGRSSASTAHQVVNLDKLTYAGQSRFVGTDRGRFQATSLSKAISRTAGLHSTCMREHDITHVVNFAAESHVDRSIDGPAEFVQTNVVGTFRMLEAARKYWHDSPPALRRRVSLLARVDRRGLRLARRRRSCSPNQPLTRRIRPTRRRRPRRTILCAPIITPMGCRP